MKIGTKVKRDSLEPFELDFLEPKLKSATGVITRSWVKTVKNLETKMYEVLWSWRNGESSIAHYTEHQISKI